MQDLWPRIDLLCLLFGYVERQRDFENSHTFRFFWAVHQKPTACSPMVMTLWVNLMAIGLKVGLNMKANHSGVDYKEGLKKQNKTPSKIKQAHTKSMENGCCRQFRLLFLTLSFTLTQRRVFFWQNMTSALSVVCHKSKVSATTEEQPTSWVQGSLW